jgi:hypothetical protein
VGEERKGEPVEERRGGCRGVGGIEGRALTTGRTDGTREGGKEERRRGGTEVEGVGGTGGRRREGAERGGGIGRVRRREGWRSAVRGEETRDLGRGEERKGGRSRPEWESAAHQTNGQIMYFGAQ